MLTICAVHRTEWKYLYSYNEDTDSDEFIRPGIEFPSINRRNPQKNIHFTYKGHDKVTNIHMYTTCVVWPAKTLTTWRSRTKNIKGHCRRKVDVTSNWVKRKYHLKHTKCQRQDYIITTLDSNKNYASQTVLVDILVVTARKKVAQGFHRFSSFTGTTARYKHFLCPQGAPTDNVKTTTKCLPRLVKSWIFDENVLPAEIFSRNYIFWLCCFLV